MKKSRVGVSVTVEGFSNASDIANLFASKYEDLYTSVPYNCQWMDTIAAEINTR